MKLHPTRKEFEPGRGYTKEDWDAVDSPELTAEDFASMRPATEVLPPEFFDYVDAVRKARGRPPLDKPKEAIKLRLDPDVLERYRATGKGWQSRINADLRKAIGLD